MKKRTKKRLFTYLLVAVWLISCYLIGQTKRSNADNEPGNIKDSAIFFNVQQIDKDIIPWGITAGEIALEDESNAWFLTPDTGLQIIQAKGAKLQYRIHPWMKEISNGAKLMITFDEDQVVLAVEKDWEEIMIPEKVQNTRIEVMNTDDNEGDWVIIQTKDD